MRNALLEGVNITWDSRVSHAFFDSSSSKTCIETQSKATGGKTTHIFDLVVGADGTRSCLRSLVIDEPKDYNHYGGTCIVQGIIPDLAK